MAISIKSNPNGLSGSIQVNGVDAVFINPARFTARALPSQFRNDGKSISN